MNERDVTRIARREACAVLRMILPPLTGSCYGEVLDAIEAEAKGEPCHSEINAPTPAAKSRSPGPNTTTTTSRPNHGRSGSCSTTTPPDLLPLIQAMREAIRQHDANYARDGETRFTDLCRIREVVRSYLAADPEAVIRGLVEESDYRWIRMIHWRDECKKAEAERDAAEASERAIQVEIRKLQDERDEWKARSR